MRDRSNSARLLVRDTRKDLEGTSLKVPIVSVVQRHRPSKEKKLSVPKATKFIGSYSL